MTGRHEPDRQPTGVGAMVAVVGILLTVLVVVAAVLVFGIAPPGR